MPPWLELELDSEPRLAPELPDALPNPDELEPELPLEPEEPDEPPDEPEPDCACVLSAKLVMHNATINCFFIPD